MDGKDTHAFGNGVGEILRKLQLYLYYFISLKISEANIAKGLLCVYSSWWFITPSVTFWIFKNIP